jgi:ribosomal protein S18 acetylase RimI-like enzyme
MHISEAEPAECDAMLALFPRLASFELPNDRNPRHLWEGDAAMLRDWAAGNCPDCLVNVARSDDGALLGLTMVSLREELLSHTSSAHLEAIVVAKGAEGQGVGRALLDAAEEGAKLRGARSMSLHVFSTNESARRLYAKAGFDEELIRCIKPFDKDSLT